MVEEPRPAGCPSDIHVQAGRYDGYEVSVDCPSGKHGGMPLVVIRGLGSKPLPQLGRGPIAGEIQRQFFALAEEARKVAAVPSIHDVRGTAPCRTEGWVIGLKLSDYRDVDAAVRNLEPWIVREDLRGEIVLLPSPVPVFRLGAESP
jgi:hypothetical protein